MSVVLLWFAIGLPLANAAQAPSKLVVGLISTTTAEETRKKWQPLLGDLSKNLGMPVESVASTNYADIVSGLREGRIHVAWMGNKIALEAVEDEKAQVFVQFVKLDGSLGYKSLLITPLNGQIKSLDDALGKKGSYVFMNGDPKSTSGYLVPSYYVFSRNKITPEAQFAKVISGNHKTNFMAIAKGEADLATNNTEDMEKFKKDYPEEFKRVRIIWQSTLIPNDPMLYRNDLPGPIKVKLEKFFLGYGKSGTQLKTLEQIHGLSGFKRSNNAQLIPIADLELFSQLRKNQDDEKKSAQEKQQAYEAITARFGKLGAVLQLDRNRLRAN